VETLHLSLDVNFEEGRGATQAVAHVGVDRVVSGGGAIITPVPTVEVLRDILEALDKVVEVDHHLGLEANHLSLTSVEVF